MGRDKVKSYYQNHQKHLFEPYTSPRPPRNNYFMNKYSFFNHIHLVPSEVFNGQEWGSIFSQTNPKKRMTKKNKQKQDQKQKRFY